MAKKLLQSVGEWLLSTDTIHQKGIYLLHCISQQEKEVKEQLPMLLHTTKRNVVRNTLLENLADMDKGIVMDEKAKVAISSLLQAKEPSMQTEDELFLYVGKYAHKLSVIAKEHEHPKIKVGENGRFLLYWGKYLCKQVLHIPVKEEIEKGIQSLYRSNRQRKEVDTKVLEDGLSAVVSVHNALEFESSVVEEQPKPEEPVFANLSFDTMFSQLLDDTAYECEFDEYSRLVLVQDESIQPTIGDMAKRMKLIGLLLGIAWTNEERISSLFGIYHKDMEKLKDSNYASHSILELEHFDVEKYDRAKNEAIEHFNAQ